MDARQCCQIYSRDRLSSVPARAEMKQPNSGKLGKNAATKPSVSTVLHLPCFATSAVQGWSFFPEVNLKFNSCFHAPIASPEESRILTSLAMTITQFSLCNGILSGVTKPRSDPWTDPGRWENRRVLSYRLWENTVKALGFDGYSNFKFVILYNRVRLGAGLPPIWSGRDFLAEETANELRGFLRERLYGKLETEDRDLHALLDTTDVSIAQTQLNQYLKRHPVIPPTFSNLALAHNAYTVPPPLPPSELVTTKDSRKDNWSHKATQLPKSQVLPSPRIRPSIPNSEDFLGDTATLDLYQFSIAQTQLNQYLKRHPVIPPTFSNLALAHNAYTVPPPLPPSELVTTKDSRKDNWSHKATQLLKSKVLPSPRSLPEHRYQRSDKEFDLQSPTPKTSSVTQRHWISTNRHGPPHSNHSWKRSTSNSPSVISRTQSFKPFRKGRTFVSSSSQEFTIKKRINNQRFFNDRPPDISLSQETNSSSGASSMSSSSTTSSQEVYKFQRFSPDEKWVLADDVNFKYQPRCDGGTRKSFSPKKLMTYVEWIDHTEQSFLVQVGNFSLSSRFRAPLSSRRRRLHGGGFRLFTEVGN
ncbi:unnamed protein product [Cyprideis torosa]|uniref:Uncharacterized protein n=1 Tax=Cyprideis torosa TaxID=163714 RepID=A0A7R8W3T1_9CRUS|nr:unnamed protein product [Cyprideis torosa]CAG0879951.1 unnamed protein product [Cyprideis torosa]